MVDSSQRPERIRTLVSLRFWGILLIVLHHISDAVYWQPQGLGSLGTTFFFVLSGFVLPLGYLRISTFREAASFLLNRVVRIYPIHLLTFAASIYFYWYWKMPVSIDTVFINIFLLQSWVDSMTVFFSFNSLSWFLSTIFFCYFVFVLVMYRPGLFLPLAIFFSLISVVVSTASIIAEPKNVQGDLALFFFHVYPPHRLLIFLCGTGASLLFVRFYQRMRTSVSISVATLLEVIVVGIFLDRIFFKTISPYLLLPVKAALPGLGISANYLVDNYFYCTFLTVAMLWILGLEKGLISRMLRNRYMILLGNISFCVYMSHQVIFRFFAIYRDQLIGYAGAAWVGVGAGVVVFTVSYVMWMYIERPLTRYSMSSAKAWQE